MFKAASNKSNAKRALKSIGDKAFAAADQLIVEVDGKWGFDVEAAQAVQNPVEEVVTPVKPCGMGAMVAQLTGEAKSVETTKGKQVATKQQGRIEKDRPEQNGVKRPSAGGLCRAVWDALDAMQAETGTAPTAAMIRAKAKEAGWNENNASIEFYQWRKFNGVTGRSSN